MILTLDSRFKRSLKRLTKKNPQLQDKILAVLELLANDPFTPSLKAHLNLQGTLATSVLRLAVMGDRIGSPSGSMPRRLTANDQFHISPSF